MKKFLSLALALCLVFALGITAFADESDPPDSNIVDEAGAGGTVPVVLNAEASTFNVTVPMALPISVDEDGVVDVSDEVVIVNNSYGAVKVADLEITGANGWATVAHTGFDPARVPVGSKMFSMVINDNETTGNDTIEFDITDSGFAVMDGVGTEDEDGNICPIEYDAIVPAQAEALTDAVIANVVFTLAWDLVEAPIEP